MNAADGNTNQNDKSTVRERDDFKLSPHRSRAEGWRSNMIKKTVTPRKVAANQSNANGSTGPRTEWGKFNSRFNAVKDGLFAMEVVIPDCDGDDARRKFSEL